MQSMREADLRGRLRCAALVAGLGIPLAFAAGAWVQDQRIQAANASPPTTPPPTPAAPAD
jgi:hypothetical protein